MRLAKCYNAEELSKYLQGRTDDQLSDAIESHILNCARCEETLSEIDGGEDTIVRSLQIKGAAGAGDVPEWIAEVAKSPFVEHRGDEGDSPLLVQPTEQIGDYELVNVLGQGGMSVVFSGRHKHLGRQVAVKLLLPTQQHRMPRERFTREMRAVGGLNHPAIVRATDAGEVNGTMYLVMDQVDGIDLNQLGKLQGPLPVAEGCAIAFQAAEGLLHAHQQGIIHRDIKPSNLMLDRAGQVKILDFGLARTQSSSADVSMHTTMGQLLGTLDYMAPEQASGDDVNQQADVYALGATLFKLLTGVPPHGRSSDTSIIEFLHRLANEPAQRLSELRPSVSKELCELVNRTLHRQPDERIDLESFLREVKPSLRDAKLTELSHRAITARESESTSKIPKSPIHQATLTKFWATDSAPGKSVETHNRHNTVPSNRKSSGNRWGTIVATLVSMAGIVFLGILMKLTTPEGEILIETELPSVNVELVDARDQVSDVKVEQGEKSTTVRTGQYRIRLDSPAEDLEVTPNQVTVTRDKVFRVVVSKRETAQEATAAQSVADVAKPTDPEQRNPAAALQATLQLQDTIAQLARERNRPQADSELIGKLESQVTELRALSNPIPTQPVYRGRTLPDWVAQMRFERDGESRKAAAESVIQLASTRPDQERAELLLEASHITWRSYRFPRYVEGNFSDPFPSNTTERFQKLGVDARNAILIKALKSDDPDTNRLGLRVCVESRQEIRSDGSWRPVLEELKTQSKIDRPYPNETETMSGDHEASAPPTAVWKLVYASCVPDQDVCKSELTSIEAERCYDWVIRTMFDLVRERNLAIPRNDQLKWISYHLAKLNSGYLQSGNDQIDPIRLGVLSDIAWTLPLEQQQQQEINQLALPLLAEAQKTQDAAKDNAPRMLQYVAISRIKVLVWLIENVGLTGDAKERAINILTQRLEHLLEIRPKASRLDYYSELDTPDEIAAALVIMTGELPRLLSKHEDETFQPAQQDRYRYSGRSTVMSSQWWPIEWVKSIGRSSSSRSALLNARMGSRGGSFGRSSQQVSPVKPTLLAAMLDNVELAPAAGGLLTADSLANPYRKHPPIRKLVDQMLSEAADEHARATCYSLWKKDKSVDAALQQIVQSVSRDDLASLRFAINALDEDDASFPEAQRLSLVKEALDKIHQSKKLNYKDLLIARKFLSKTKKLSEYAMGFVENYIDSPSFRQEQQRLRPATRGGTSALSHALRMIFDPAHMDNEFYQKVRNGAVSFSGADSRTLKEFGEKFGRSLN